LDIEVEHRGSWRERATDPALTALLAVQCFILLIASPAAAMGHWSGRFALQFSVLALAALVFVISHGRVPTAIAVLAIASGLAGVTMQLWRLSDASLMLGIVGGLAGQLLLIYLLGHAVLAPGVITRHRVLGAVALYLGLGMAFAAAYRFCCVLAPGCLANIPAETESFQAYNSVLYFSFATLTSVGYGDVLPVQPFVRALANLEAIIGQLYPATLLARLVTLELERRRH
jgi:hypothetical protein